MGGDGSLVVRPLIPKKLASKLRAVFEKVRSQRDRLAHAEARIEDYQARVDEFEADPERFAELHYPGHEVNSYPVQTNLERTRENLAYRIDRMPVYLADLATAERLKIDVELEVLAELNAMRKDTPGRVAWPSEPPLLEYLRKEAFEFYRKERKRAERYRVKRERERTEAEVKRKAEREVFMRDINARMEHKFSLMPPMRAVAERAYWEAVKAAFASSNISFELVGAIASGDEEAHKKIVDDAIDRFKASIDKNQSEEM